VEQDYTFYFKQLAYLKKLADPECKNPGPEPEVTPGKPQAGYYRTQSHQAVAIWHSEDHTKVFAQTTARNGSSYLIRDPDSVDELFSKVCRHPVAGDTYTRFVQAKTWPEDVETPAERGIGDNSAALAPHERIRAELNDFLDRARSWLKGIGKVATKEHADKAANYAEEFAKLEKKADEEQKRLKKPILEAGRKIDGEWKPVIAAASDAKREFKKACEDYLIAVKKQAAEQERRDREDAAARGEFLQHRPSAAVAGTSGGRVGLRTYKEAVVADWKALAQHYLSMEELPKAVQEGLLRAAEPIVLAGGTIPGVILKTEQRAA
jgi:hypothetical protein